MLFDRQGHEFDLRVQRFLVQRWETDVGALVREEIIAGLKNSVEIRGILDRYILKDPENSEPYGYPIYPADRLNAGHFWVLHQDDLRGIHLYNEDFSGSPSFEVKMMDYARFYNCTFDRANLERCSLTRVYFENCRLHLTVLADAGGFFTTFRDCDLSGACLWMATFIDSDLTACNLRNAYFEGAKIINPIVDHRTDFGFDIARTWKTRSLPSSELPDIYRAIRTAYTNAELHQQADAFLYRERNASRSYILLPKIASAPTARGIVADAVDAAWDCTMGYGTKPFRLLPIGLCLALGFALIYAAFGVPFVGHRSISTLSEYLYFSATSFATLGYGDLSFGAEHPVLRLLSASEALIGAAWIAIFVAALSRKLMR